MKGRDLELAARRGEPSYVWREGQERRLGMILEAAGDRIRERVLVDGCGVGIYAEHLAPHAGVVIGLDLEFGRVQQARGRGIRALCARGETLPFAESSFDLVLSHEVLEHVDDDRAAVAEMVRVLRPGGRLVLFAPNRGYPFETHGIYWRGRYYFGNIPLVNYLPRALRDHLAPHVRVYSAGDLADLFAGLRTRFITRRVIFGAYDNVIARWPRLGRRLRAFTRTLEGTPLGGFGLSHFWVVERT